jgi:hypothetical protein
MLRTALRTTAVALLVLITAQAAWSGPVEGEGRVRGKSLTQSTIQIDDTIYRVTPNTSMHWADGKRLTLTALPAPELPDRTGEWPLIKARFHGQSSGTGAVLDRIEIEYGHE